MDQNSLCFAWPRAMQGSELSSGEVGHACSCDLILRGRGRSPRPYSGTGGGTGLQYDSAVNGSVTWIQLSDPTPNGFGVGVSTNVSESEGTVSGPLIARGFGEVDFFNEAHGGGFEIQTATIFSPGAFNLDRGTLAVTVVPEPPTWATTLLGFAGLGL